MKYFFSKEIYCLEPALLAASSLQLHHFILEADTFKSNFRDRRGFDSVLPSSISVIIIFFFRFFFFLCDIWWQEARKVTSRDKTLHIDAPPSGISQRVYSVMIHLTGDASSYVDDRSPVDEVQNTYKFSFPCSCLFIGQISARLSGFMNL